MSSSSRKKRSDPDNFPTPLWATRRLFENPAFLALIGDGLRWLEPSAGDGSIIEVVNEFIPAVDWAAIELRDTRGDLQSLGLAPSQITIDDFFAVELNELFDVSILNPPFKLGIEFVMKCREHSRVVVVFQTLNFLGSDKRHPWLSEDMPDVFVIPNRVAHKGTNRSDSVYSAWFVWGEQPKRESDLRLLALTLKEERRACYMRLRQATDEKAAILKSLFEAEE